MTDHQRGLLFICLGVAVIIPDATLVRLVEAPSLTNAVWRTGLSAMALGVFIVVRSRSRHRHHRLALQRQQHLGTAAAVRLRSQLIGALKSLGPWGAASSVLWSVNPIAFVVAVNNTAVANVLLILALSPIWAALFTRLLFRVPIPPRTLVAIPFALLGVSIALGWPIDSEIRFGDVIALIGSLALAGNLTIVRAHSNVDMVPVVAIGNVLGFVALSSVGTSFAITFGDLLPLLLLGLIVVPGFIGLIAAGARYLSSPEITLLLTGETVLSPILAAVVVGELIHTSAYVGGAIVITTLVTHAWVGLRRDQEAIGKPDQFT